MDAPRRMIGDSQMSYWFLALECFLKPFLAQETRVEPTDSREVNMWLIKYIEELPHRGSHKAEPRPSFCTLYRVSIIKAVPQKSNARTS